MRCWTSAGCILDTIEGYFMAILMAVCASYLYFVVIPEHKKNPTGKYSNWPPERSTKYLIMFLVFCGLSIFFAKSDYKRYLKLK